MKKTTAIIKLPIESYLLVNILEAFKSDEEMGFTVIIESKDNDLIISVEDNDK